MSFYLVNCSVLKSTKQYKFKDEFGYRSLLQSLAAVNFAACLPAAVINTIVVIAIFRSPPLKKPSFLLVGLLASSDAFTGFIAQPLYGVHLILASLSRMNCHLAIFISYCGAINASLSMMAVFAIATERYLFIIRPYIHERYVTSRRVYGVFAVLWLFCFVNLMISYFTRISYISRLTMAVAMLASLVWSTFVYTSIYRLTKKIRRRLSSDGAIDQQSPSKETSGKANRATRFLFIVTVTTFVFYTPVIVRYSLYPVFKPLDWLNRYIDYALNTFILLNSIANPFVYCWQSPPIRRGMTGLFSRSQDEAVEASEYRGGTSSIKQQCTSTAIHTEPK